MIHAHVSDMKHIPRIESSAINGTGAHVKQVNDGGQDFLMMLIAYPKERTDGLINDLTYKR